MTLEPIGDIGDASLSISTKTVTWDTTTEWRNGTQSDTQTYYGRGDLSSSTVALMSKDFGAQSAQYSAGSNCSGVTAYPGGNGGSGAILNGSDGRGGYVEYRDKTGTLLKDWSATEKSTKGVGYHSGRDTVFTGNDTDSQTLREYNHSGSQLNGWTPGGAFVQGVSSDGTYVYCGGEDGNVYKFDPSSGSAAQSWAWPWGGSGSNIGMGWNGFYVVVINSSNGDVYYMDPSDGTTVAGPIAHPAGGTSANKSCDLTVGYGEWWWADRGSDVLRTYPIQYPASGTHTTTTKS